MNGKSISILSICLEEDAARKVDAADGEVTYRLDRLGIPLIEVATGPDMRTPEEVMEVALRIGTLLRATKRVKRGIGTIREDSSYRYGRPRIEINGVQELRLSLYVETRSGDRGCRRSKRLWRVAGRKSGIRARRRHGIFGDESQGHKGGAGDKGRVMA